MDIEYAALIVSAAACVIAIVSALIARNAVNRNLRPVLVFVRDDKQIWWLTNIGTGPALDILVEEKALATQSLPPGLHLVPPLPKDGSFPIPSGPTSSALSYVVQFKDAEGKYYNTTCKDYSNDTRLGKAFDDVDKSKITPYGKL